MRNRADGTVELKCAPEHEASMYAMGPANGLYARLSEVTCPVQVVCGGESRSISPELGARIVDRLPHGTLEVWAGRGHFGPLEDPGAAVESMLNFCL